MEKENVSAAAHTFDQTNLTELVLFKSKYQVDIDNHAQSTVPVLLLNDAFELNECGEQDTAALVEEVSMEGKAKIDVSEAENIFNHVPLHETGEQQIRSDYSTDVDDCPYAKPVKLAKQKLLFCQFEGCHRSFTWRTHLQYHSLTHTGSRQYKCPFKNCHKQQSSFYTQQRLDVHLRSHTGERPFLCVECDRSFATAGNLKNHCRTHSGERPFCCDVSGCGKSFSELSSLKKHSLVHSGDKPFKCDLCKKAFSQIGSRNVHMRRHHHEKDLAKSDPPRCPERHSGAFLSVVPVEKSSSNILDDVSYIADDGVLDTLVVPVGVDDDEIVTIDIHPKAEMCNSNDGLHLDDIGEPSDEETISLNDCQPDQLISPNSHANVVVVAQPQSMTDIYSSDHTCISL